METPVFNEDLVITFAEGVVGLWNLRSGEQFEIYEQRFVERIYELYETLAVEYQYQSEDSVLLQAGVLLQGDEAERYHVEKAKGPWGWDLLSKIFHFGTKHKGVGETSERDKGYTASGYLDYCESIYSSAPDIEIERLGRKYELPRYSTGSLSKNSLEEALLNRITSRNFIEEPIHTNLISDVLYMTFGKVHGDRRKEEFSERGIITVGYRRSSPSAGCLQATEAYLIANRIDGIPRGVYHYQPGDHSLTHINELNDYPMDKALCYQEFALQAAFLIVLTSRFDKLWWKYPHSRAYRSGLMDIGHLSQTYYLVAGAYGLNTWCTGYFIDDMLNELVNADGFKEHALFILAGGPGTFDPLNPSIEGAITKHP